ncbi:ATP-binding protein [Micromonospora hortensis]|uniref:ATP-binding protein n=1 Tax=Micromonospora hortensis TaxID=2911209 RepID=UPI001EE92C52|nr:ATP-binding protein [Micromonospora hortensis]MCG5453048.1 ATP-binding protein [Micromonospora hortensis]
MSLADMKDARAQVWRRLLSTSTPIQVKSIRIVESEIFEEQEISFGTATCIVGSHGLGKTLMLRLLESVFGFNSDIPPFVGGRKYGDPGIDPVTGVIEVTMSVAGELISQTVDLSAHEGVRAAAWEERLKVDFWPAFNSVAELASVFNWYFQNFGWNGTTVIRERHYKKSERVALAGILGRKYESVVESTILVDSRDENDWFAHRPYVTTTSGGRKADSGTFSLGELWVYQVFWEQGRLSPGCLYLLDEPESFLALRGHRPFIDEVARRALERKIQLVVATHSPQVLSRFPVENVRMCVRGSSGKIRLVQPESLEEVRRVVGIEEAVKTLALVEDALAGAVLSGIFGCLNVPLAGIEIVEVDGESNVIAGVRILSRSARVRVVGVLDADQRHQLKDSPGLLVLPGKADPEQELFGFALKEHVAVAAALGRSSDSLLAALDGHDFLPHQYWPRYLASRIGLNEQFVVNVLIQLWLEDPGVRAQALELAAALT